MLQLVEAIVLGILFYASEITGEWTRLTGTCAGASSSFDTSGWHCSKALDGKLKLYDNSEWSTACTAADTAWIKIQFNQSYTLQYIRMMQRAYEHEQFKDFTLTFEDGSTQSGVFSQRNGVDKYDIKGRWWDEFAISGVVSSWVQIDITSMYTSSCNGFVEVEVYTGQNTNPCPTYYTLLGESCYIIDQNQTWSRDDAQAHCKGRGGHLVELETQEEVTTVKNWINNVYGSDNSLWAGGSLTGGQWQWTYGDIIGTFPSGQPHAGDYTILNEGSDFDLSSSSDGASYALCEAAMAQPEVSGRFSRIPGMTKKPFNVDQIL